MEEFIKDCISDFGILGALCAAVFCVVLFPFFLTCFIGSCIADFDEWSTTLFDSGDEEEENEC